MTNSYNPYKTYSSYWWKYWLNLPCDITSYFQRIWEYRFILWHDNDWDFSSVERMMRFKLKRISKHISDHALICHTEDKVAELARVDVMLRNVIDEDPDDEWSMHYYQWDQHIKGFKDCKNQREHKRALKLSWERQKRNWHSLWKYIEKYAQGWSD